MKSVKRRAAVAACVVAALLAACNGTPGTPNGSVVNDPGSGNPPPAFVGANVTITVPVRNGKNARRRTQYVSPGTRSVSIALASANGAAVGNVSATTIDTDANAPHCSKQSSSIVCSGSVEAVAGSDVFNVTTYAWPNAAGPVLASGTVRATIRSGGGSFDVSPAISLAIDGVIAKLKLYLARKSVDRGTRADVPVTLEALDGSGATIVGGASFESPIALSIQGDTAHAFVLHGANLHGSSLSIVKPTSGLDLAYDGNERASSIALQATTSGQNTASAQADLGVSGTPPPPPGGTLYVLNAGAKLGLGATVTVYATSAHGNAAPSRTLQLSSSLYARSIAVDAHGNLYVGYFDNANGFQVSNGTPDTGNIVAVYAPNASGSAQPQREITADPATQSALFPAALAFDASGDLVTYGATKFQGALDDGVLIYAPNASQAAAPAHAWTFATPQIRFAGPTGLALDAAGNFYVNGTLKTALGPSNGVFVASAGDRDNPAASPARTIPWDSTTQLVQGHVSNIGLDQTGSIYVANFVVPPSNAKLCQAAINVFASGASGGTTDVPPLRVLTIAGASTTSPACYAPSQNPLATYFPAIANDGSSTFVADDFGDAVYVVSQSASGNVTPAQTIAGSATELNAPIAVTVSPASSTSQLSDRAAARSDLGDGRRVNPTRPVVH